MRERRVLIFITLLLAIGLPVAALAGKGGTQTYMADLQPLNGGLSDGEATLVRDGDQLTIEIQADGLDDVFHIMHIHGFETARGTGVCPTPDADANGDGFVDLAEGLPDYGPILLNIDPFPTGSEIDFANTFTVDTDELMPLQHRHIVIHGLDINGDGDVNDGRDLNGDGVISGFLEENFELTMPVACGEIDLVPGN